MEIKESGAPAHWAGADWNAGVRGLFVALGCIGLASSLQSPWLLALGLTAFCYTLATAFGLHRPEAIRALAVLAFRVTAAVVALAIGCSICVLLVNASAPALATAGNVAMIALLGSTACAVVALLVRTLWQPVAQTPDRVRESWGFVVGQISWAVRLVAFQLEETGRSPKRQFGERDNQRVS